MENTSVVTVITLSAVNEAMTHRITIFTFTLVFYSLVLFVNVAVIAVVVPDPSLHEPMYIFLCVVCLLGQHCMHLVAEVVRLRDSKDLLRQQAHRRAGQHCSHRHPLLHVHACLLVSNAFLHLVLRTHCCDLCEVKRQHGQVHADLRAPFAVFNCLCHCGTF